MEIVNDKVLTPAQEFAADSVRLLRSCSKPEWKG